MKLQLPDVTLVMVETREHALARLAVKDCMDLVDFGDVLILTDNPGAFKLLPGPHRFHIVPDWPDKMGWSRSWWFDVPPLLRTRQTLNIQWDSWVWDTSMWGDYFLHYDFIGAPWWYKDGKNVGNGGFCLKSTRLARYIYDRRTEYPCDTPVDDDLLCRTYRPKLEEAGFTWAPEEVAHQFAFECCRPEPKSRHFGFHAIYNWPEVLDHKNLLTRLNLALGSGYIRDGRMMKVLCEKYPALTEELIGTAMATRKEGSYASN